MSGPILLVDNNTEFNLLVQEFLNSNGFSVHVEIHGDNAAELIFCLHPILVILEIMLPGLDGLAICRSIRASFNGPILILTTLSDDIDHVAALEAGADGYLVKPIKPRVLLAHIRALLRCSANYWANSRFKIKKKHGMGYPVGNHPELLEIGALTINTRCRSGPT